MEKRIFAIGGGRAPDPVRESMLGLVGPRPRVLLVPTAGGEDPAATLRWYEWLSGQLT